MTRYVMTASTIGGERLDERVVNTTPAVDEAAAFGDRCRTNYVSVTDDHERVTLYGRDAVGSWSVVAADVDAETAREVCLWFDLTQHYPVLSDDDDGPDDHSGGHPLDRLGALIPERGDMSADRAVSLVVERIRARRLDYPTEGLAADRFAVGWSVYAPVDVDESDPMAFLDMPVGRSVFLVSDLGRVKELSSSIPPQLAEGMFTAEEAYVRGLPPGEEFMTGLRDEAMRLDADGGGAAGISSFTVEETPAQVIAARAEALLGPIAQQVALLGPRGWDRFTAVFSLTVAGEIAQLRFWSGSERGSESVNVPVPEHIALLVRRQRQLAARLPAGPWWRLLLTVSHTAGTNARVATEYDYGDEPFPEDQLLPPENYRDDLAAYPRTGAPAWLSAYIAGAGGPAPHRTPAPGPASLPTGGPVLDTTVGRTQLRADAQAITYGRKSIALDDAEWVSYSATHTAEKRFMFPTFYENTWDFRLGRYPYYGRGIVTVQFSKGGRRAEQPEEWAFLVSLVKRYVEPRLLEELAAQVHRGETVTVGGSLRINRDGIASTKPRFSLPWEAVGPARLHNGVIWLYQKGAEKALVNLPLSNPNAALIPDLFAVLGPDTSLTDRDSHSRTVKNYSRLMKRY